MVLLSDPENRKTSHRGVDLGHRYRIHGKQRLVAARGVLGGSFRGQPWKVRKIRMNPL
jgi:hypothetical protein